MAKFKLPFLQAGSLKTKELETPTFKVVDEFVVFKDDNNLSVFVLPAANVSSIETLIP